MWVIDWREKLYMHTERERERERERDVENEWLIESENGKEKVGEKER